MTRIISALVLGVMGIISLGTLQPTLEYKNSKLVILEIQDEWSGYEDLKKICECESGLIHYDKNGQVLRGRKVKEDIGICQINLSYHGKRAKELNLDLFKRRDNIRYAKLLWNEKGSIPWRASRGCHGL